MEFFIKYAKGKKWFSRIKLCRNAISRSVVIGLHKVKLYSKIQVVKSFSLITFFILLFFTQGCFKHWSEKEKEDFEKKCSQADSFQGLDFSVSGFSYAEIDTIFIKEMNNNKCIDSFSVYAGQDSYDSARTQCLFYIDRKMFTKHAYVFLIPNQQPYVLDSMKMVMWAQWTMTSEDYGCVMGDYILNGVRFSHSRGPTLIKNN